MLKGLSSKGTIDEDSEFEGKHEDVMESSFTAKGGEQVWIRVSLSKDEQQLLRVVIIFGNRPNNHWTGQRRLVNGR